MTTLPQIKSWSFSRLIDFEACNYRAKLKMIDKVLEPERPLKPGQTEHANDRGTRIHEAIEAFIRDKGDFPVEARSYRAEIQSLRERFLTHSVSLEGEWGFNKDWEVCDYRSAWLRVKCDAVIFMKPTGRLFDNKGNLLIDNTGPEAIIVDYKTGRKHGNEIKHGEQVQLYGLSAAIKFPLVKKIRTELWYLDQDDIMSEEKPASKWLYQLKQFNNRGLKMTNCTDFKPNPNAFTCNYCPYKNEGCEYSIINSKAIQNVYARKAAPRRKGEPK